ncbi:hypothetical protein DEFR109230_10710 [Deinococcus frigens]
MENRLLIALVVALDDLIPAEHILTDYGAAVGLDDLLVVAVIIAAHDLVARRLSGHEPVVFLAGQAVVHQVQQDLRIGRHGIVQVQREKPQPILHRDLAAGLRAAVVQVLGAFGQHNDGVGVHAGNRLASQDVGRHAMLEGRHEAALGLELFIPQPVLRAGLGRHVDLVDGRIVPHPGIAPCHRLGVLGKMDGQLRVLEIAQPVRHPEVHQIKDWRDLQPFHLGHHLIGKFPVVLARTLVNAVIGETVTQVLEAQVLDQMQVLLPALVVVALFQLVAPYLAVLDGGIRAFDAGGEHEIAGGPCGHARAAASPCTTVLVSSVIAVAQLFLDDLQKALAH